MSNLDDYNRVMAAVSRLEREHFKEPCHPSRCGHRLINYRDPLCNERGTPESECPPHCRHGGTGA